MNENLDWKHALAFFLFTLASYLAREMKKSQTRRKRLRAEELARPIVLDVPKEVALDHCKACGNLFPLNQLCANGFCVKCGNKSR